MRYDIAIIGAGPGGYESALYAAAQGFSVVLIERDHVGGTCLNYGCIPTKVLLASAKKYKALKSAAAFGLKFDPDSISLSYSDVLLRKENILTTQRKAIQMMLDKAGVTTLSGDARLAGPNSLMVADTLVEADNIIIATGTTPADIGIVKIDNRLVFSSDGFFDMVDLPGSMLILGGGVMGCEFAFMLNQFGVSITLLEQQDSILPLEDVEISTLITREMKKAGIKVVTSVSIDSMDISAASVTAITSTDMTYCADRMLVTVGRKKQTGSLNLDSFGISLNLDGSIPVNEQMQTKLASVFAIGDVTGKKMVAHVATEQGRVVIDYLKGNIRSINYNNVPSAIFTIPEIGSVGITEKTAQTDGVDYSVKKYLYRGLGKAHAEDEISGLFKLIIDNRNDRILGAHFAGAHASDIIMEAAIAMSNALPYTCLTSVVHPHPTYSEGVKSALLE